MNTWMHRPFQLALAMFFFLGCGSDKRQPGQTVEREGQPSVVYVDDNDPKMATAIEKARSTVDRFIHALENPNPSQQGFSVKLPVKDGEQVEHMWVLPVKYADGKFTGTINNEPDKVSTVKIGDQVDVGKEQISDWMYVENGKLVGGYTIRVLIDSAPQKEREKLVGDLPFSID